MAWPLELQSFFFWDLSHCFSLYSLETSSIASNFLPYTPLLLLLSFFTRDLRYCSGLSSLVTFPISLVFLLWKSRSPISTVSLILRYIMCGLAVVFFMIVTSHFVYAARPIINEFYLTTFECLRRLVKHFKFRRLVHHYCFILELIKLGTWVKNLWTEKKQFYVNFLLHNKL